MRTITFFIAAVASMSGALGLLFSRSIIRAAIFLVVCMAGMSTFCFLLNAPFVGASLVLLSSSLALVLLIFTLATVDAQASLRLYAAHSGLLSLAALFGFSYVIYRLLASIEPQAITASIDGTLRNVGHALMLNNSYLMISIAVLLLAATLAVVIIASKR